MDPERDYYAILGVRPDADERTIRRAYRRLAGQYHPDRNAGETDLFHQVQEAYDLLSDPAQREIYDHWRRTQGLDGPPAFVLQITPSQDAIACLGEPQALYILLKISASPDLESHRLPLNLCLVLDRSTSMRGARLQQVKEAARYIVEQMEPADVLSIVVFSDRAETILPGSTTLDKAAARSVISRIHAGGGTELLQGLNAGLQEIAAWRSQSCFSALILLTDGQTYGDEEGCLQQARLAGQQQVPLVTMGVGADWNDDLLDRMATLSGGTSLYIDSASRIAQAFHEQIRRLGSIFAHDLHLSLHTGEDVSVEELYRIGPEIGQVPLENGTASLGALEKEQPQVLLMELLVGQHRPGQARLLQIGVEGVVSACERQVARCRQDVVVTFGGEVDDIAGLSDPTVRRGPVPPDIVSALAKLTIYKMQERAMVEAQMGQIDAAVNRLKTVATRLLNIGEQELAHAALLEAGYLAQTGQLSGEGRKKLRYGTRGLGSMPKEVRS